jgi:mono/diheme cytochrome c family protein
MHRSFCATLAALLTLSGAAAADTPPGDAKRGRDNLLGKSYNPPTLSLDAYRNVWKQWGLPQQPAKEEHDRLFRERYGLHPAPYANDGYPMGLRVADGLFGGKALATDCLICHGGSVLGRSYIGLGNTALDFQAFMEEMPVADGRKYKPPFTFTNVRGTSEAGAMSVYLLSYRQPDLNLRARPLDLDLHDDLCEDVPAWWLLKKKRTMYHTGGGDVRSVRSLMQFMMSPLNQPAAFEAAEADFRDIRAFLLSIEAPKYPLPIDAGLAKRGEEVFQATCARCHGTYGPNWTYPNRIVPIDEIGTDRRRLDGLSRKFGEYYNQSWFAQESRPGAGDGYGGIANNGYQAPPLDGVWATAPYFHNGSVPTLYDVLNSRSRPAIFTRSYRTDLPAYDARKVGWKVEVLKEAPDPKDLPPIEFRKVYDTRRSGRGNGGHTFGDRLSDADRWAVIEYLKTL